MSCCPARATLPKVQRITITLTSIQGSQASTASEAVGLPPARGAFVATGTGISSSPMSGASTFSKASELPGAPAKLKAVGADKVSALAARVLSSAPLVAVAKLALYCSTSLGFHTWTKPMTQMSEMSAASTSGNSGPTKLETVNCVTANDTPATSATGQAVRKLRKPVNMASA